MAFNIFVPVEAGSVTHKFVFQSQHGTPETGVGSPTDCVELYRNRVDSVQRQHIHDCKRRRVITNFILNCSSCPDSMTSSQNGIKSFKKVKYLIIVDRPMTALSNLLKLSFVKEVRNNHR